ncbi:MAG: AtpZ/AtpI family protein [Candidatus Saccharimonadales bacterium]
MGNSPDKTPTQEMRRRSTAVVVLADIADTTWRLFVPIVGLLLVGRYADVRWDTKPWLMLVGALVGSVLAGLLIKNQLRRSVN